eukprot:393599_1
MSNSQIQFAIGSPRNSSLTGKHRFLFLLVLAAIILPLIAFFSVSNNSMILIVSTDSIDQQLYDTNTNTIPIIQQRNHLSIDINVTMTFEQSALSIIFRKYLDPICKLNNNNTYPFDCFKLLQSMINISIELNLDSTEINILSERISYLNSLKFSNMKQPILYIHIPKTGGTGFGKWLQKVSGKKTVHIWIPDGMTENMFDKNHYPNANRNKRQLNIIIRNRNEMNKFNKRRFKPKPYPNILYGHAAYGFDLLFLTPNEINKLSKNASELIWESRINYTYITILRHPLTRVPSHYFYHRAGEKDENHKWAMKKDLFNWIGWFEESSECLVQFISGCHHRSWYNKKYINILEKNLNPLKRRKQNESPDIFKNINITFLQYKIARNHLLLMGFIALTEYLNECVEQLKIFWNINRKQGSKYANVNRKKPKKKK